MKINWGLRWKNPTFWVQTIVAVMAVILAQAGMKWNEIVSWYAFWELIKQAIASPVTVVAVIGVLMNAINDPTVEGVSDTADTIGREELFESVTATEE